MTIHPRTGILLAGVVAIAVSGCSFLSSPPVGSRPSDVTWLLIENPRYPDVASEPEYVWVEEGKMPTTIKSLVFGKSSLLAPPDKLTKYGPPPGGGRVGARQASAFTVQSPVPPSPTKSKGAAAPPGSGAARTDATGGAGAKPLTRGYVVFVDAARVVIDLAAGDGVKVGTGVSVRREKTITIVHPISGEPLGQLDEEVATGRVVEVRDKYSVVEILEAAAGEHVQEKDRVVLR